jgi:hypothetical protein
MMVSVSKGLSVVVKEAADRHGRGVAALVTKEMSSGQKSAIDGRAMLY